MGYYTQYSIKVYSENSVGQDEFVKWIETNPKTKKGYSFYDFWMGRAESCKWYEHEEDMKEMSKKFPELVFMLRGLGEESEDTWKKYFQNGKMQSCPGTVVFEPFDPKKLT